MNTRSSAYATPTSALTRPVSRLYAPRNPRIPQPKMSLSLKHIPASRLRHPTPLPFLQVSNLG